MKKRLFLIAMGALLALGLAVSCVPTTTPSPTAGTVTPTTGITLGVASATPAGGVAATSTPLSVASPTSPGGGLSTTPTTPVP